MCIRDRQQDGFCGGDDVYDPNYMEQLMSVLGGVPVAWDSRMQSVGAPSLLSEEPTVLRLSASVLNDAKSEGAQLIVSACNLSHSVMDIYQGKASQRTGLRTNIPVVHLCEILTFALGHYNTRFAQLRTRVMVIAINFILFLRILLVLSVQLAYTSLPQFLLSYVFLYFQLHSSQFVSFWDDNSLFLL